MVRKLWQLPQHILGKIILLCNKSKVLHCSEYRGIEVIVVENTTWAIGLGTMIIVSTSMSEETIKHEYGHCRQSLYLGWLYLLVVGIPSITFNILTRLKVLKPESYYTRYPENWADRLGGVERN